MRLYFNVLNVFSSVYIIISRNIFFFATRYKFSAVETHRVTRKVHHSRRAEYDKCWQHIFIRPVN